jgi:hypothetical protein
MEDMMVGEGVEDMTIHEVIPVIGVEVEVAGAVENTTIHGVDGAGEDTITHEAVPAIGVEVEVAGDVEDLTRSMIQMAGAVVEAFEGVEGSILREEASGETGAEAKEVEETLAGKGIPTESKVRS